MSVVSFVSNLFAGRKKTMRPDRRRPSPSRIRGKRSVVLEYLDYNQERTCWWLRIFPQDDRVVVIATDLKGRLHSGASITNTIELIAHEACRQFSIAPRELVLIEHYPGPREEEAGGGHRFGEQFHWVRLKWDERGNWFVDPTWVGLTRRVVESILRQPLDTTEMKIGGELCERS